MREAEPGQGSRNHMGEGGIDAIDLLEAQHEDLERMFAELGSATGWQKRDLFEELADMLAVHAAIEERIFYPKVSSTATEQLLRSAAEQHLAAEHTVSDLLDTDVDDPSFDVQLAVLERQVTQHASAEEEERLFPILRAELDADVRVALGNEMMAYMAAIQQQPQPARLSASHEIAAGA